MCPCTRRVYNGIDKRHGYADRGCRYRAISIAPISLPPADANAVALDLVQVRSKRLRGSAADERIELSRSHSPVRLSIYLTERRARCVVSKSVQSSECIFLWKQTDYQLNGRLFMLQSHDIGRRRQKFKTSRTF